MSKLGTPISDLHANETIKRIAVTTFVVIS